MAVRLSDIFKKTSVKIVCSLLLAIVVWFVVITSIASDDSRQIKNVPVSVDIPIDLNLNLVEISNPEVTVTIQGSRFNIGSLSNKDIKVKTLLTDVTKPGEYTLKLIAIQPPDDIYKVTAVYPDTVTVTFDRIISKKFYIEQHLDGIKIDNEKHILGDIIIDPGVVVVTGPENEVKDIKHAVIGYDSFEDNLTDTLTLELPISFIDADGNEVKTKENGGEHISSDYATTSLTISVLNMKEVPFEIRFQNYSDNFPIEKLKYTMSRNTINLVGELSELDKYSSLVVGYIDVSQLNLKDFNRRSFPIRLPKGITSPNAPEFVNVMFDNKNIDSKKVNIDNISVINIPEGYGAIPINKSIENVMLIGDKAALEKITANDFVAEVDFSQISQIKTGKESFIVEIVSMTDDFVWAIGRYDINLYVHR